MDDRIKEHLQQLNKYYLHLIEMRKLKREVGRFQRAFSFWLNRSHGLSI